MKAYVDTAVQSKSETEYTLGMTQHPYTLLSVLSLSIYACPNIDLNSHLFHGLPQYPVVPTSISLF